MDLLVSFSNMYYALESIDNGTLIVNGHNVTEASAKDLVELRKEAGMVFQHFNLYPHKTVLENVTLAPIKVLGISKAKDESQKIPNILSKRSVFTK